MEEYRVYSSRTGFGFDVVQFNIYDGNYGKKTLKYHSSDKDQCHRMIDLMKLNVFSQENQEKPLTNYDPQILIITEKHGTLYIIVNNIDELNEQCFNYIRNNKNFFYIDEEDYQSKLMPQDFIDVCPDPQLKKDLEQKNRRYESYIKNQKTHNKMIENILLKLQEGTKKDCYSDLVELQEALNIEVDLIKSDYIL